MNQIGVVEHVAAKADIFEGVIVHTHPLPGRHQYGDVDQIAEIREHGVLLSVSREELHDPATSTRRRTETRETPLAARLRRAWDWLSGMRRRPLTLTGQTKDQGVALAATAAESGGAVLDAAASHLVHQRHRHPRSG